MDGETYSVHMQQLNDLAQGQKHKRCAVTRSIGLPRSLVSAETHCAVTVEQNRHGGKGQE